MDKRPIIVKIKITGINEISLYELNSIFLILSLPKESMDISKIELLANGENTSDFFRDFYKNKIAKKVSINKIDLGCIEILAVVDFALNALMTLEECGVVTHVIEEHKNYAHWIRHFFISSRDVIKDAIFVRIEKLEPEK